MSEKNEENEVEQIHDYLTSPFFQSAKSEEIKRSDEEQVIPVVRPINPKKHFREEEEETNKSNNAQQQQQQQEKNYGLFGGYIPKRVKKEQSNSQNPQNKTIQKYDSITNPPEKELKNFESNNRTPTKIFKKYTGHTKGINCIRWNPQGHLLCSAGMDHSVLIWDVFRPSTECVYSLQHTEAVTCSRWINNGSQILSCGYDKTIKLWDTETSQRIHTFNEPQFVTALQNHPIETNIFACGGSAAQIRTWDIRQKNVATEYKGMISQIHSLEWNREGDRLISASNISRRNSTNKSIVVWDYKTGVIMKDYIYSEAYNIVCFANHPTENKFIAQKIRRTSSQRP